MLTAAQKRAIVRYRAYREQPPTTIGILRPALPRFASMTIIVCGAWLVAPAAFAFFLAGMLVGAALRQVSLSWQAARIMPMIVRLIDWEKAERLLDDRGETA